MFDYGFGNLINEIMYFQRRLDLYSILMPILKAREKYDVFELVGKDKDFLERYHLKLKTVTNTAMLAINKKYGMSKEEL